MLWFLCSPVRRWSDRAAHTRWSEPPEALGCSTAVFARAPRPETAWKVKGGAVSWTHSDTEQQRQPAALPVFRYSFLWPVSALVWCTPEKDGTREGDTTAQKVHENREQTREEYNTSCSHPCNWSLRACLTLLSWARRLNLRCLYKQDVLSCAKGRHLHSMCSFSQKTLEWTQIHWYNKWVIMCISSTVSKPLLETLTVIIQCPHIDYLTRQINTDKHS